MYSLREKQLLTVYVIEVLRGDVFERKATGASRKSAMINLKRQCACAANEGRRAQEVLEYLEGQTTV